MEIDKTSQKTAWNVINQSLEVLECSPLKILQSNWTLLLGKRKNKDLTTKFWNFVSIALWESQLVKNGECNNC